MRILVDLRLFLWLGTWDVEATFDIWRFLFLLSRWVHAEWNLLDSLTWRIHIECNLFHLLWWLLCKLRWWKLFEIDFFPIRRKHSKLDLFYLLILLRGKHLECNLLHLSFWRHVFLRWVGIKGYFLNWWFLLWRVCLECYLFNIVLSFRLNFFRGIGLEFDLFYLFFGRWKCVECNLFDFYFLWWKSIKLNLLHLFLHGWICLEIDLLNSLFLWWECIKSDLFDLILLGRICSEVDLLHLTLFWWQRYYRLIGRVGIECYLSDRRVWI